MPVGSVMLDSIKQVNRLFITGAAFDVEWTDPTAGREFIDVLLRGGAHPLLAIRAIIVPTSFNTDGLPDDIVKSSTELVDGAHIEYVAGVPHRSEGLTDADALHASATINADGLLSVQLLNTLKEPIEFNLQIGDQFPLIIGQIATGGPPRRRCRWWRKVHRSRL